MAKLSDRISGSPQTQTPRENLLINGGMDIWQRGNNFTGGGYCADRWFARNSTDVDRNSSAPDGLAYSLLMTGVGNIPLIYQGIELLREGQNGPIINGKTYTLSGYCRSDTSIQNLDFNTVWQDVVGSGTNAVADQPTSTIFTNSITGVAEYFQHTFTVTTDPAATNLAYVVILKGGTADGTMRLSGLKLEQGSTATPYQSRPIGEELALCQRYYQDMGGTSEYNGQSTSQASIGGLGGTVRLPVCMRGTPTIVTSNITYTNASGLSTSDLSAHGFRYTWSGTTGGTRVTFDWTAEAEL